MSKNRSFRFTDDEIALLDAAAAYYKATTGVPHSRSDVLRRTLRETCPPVVPRTATPEAGTAELVEWRRRYSTVFGAQT